VKSKVCSKCKIEKSIDDFHKDKSHKDGYRCECKICKKAASKIYYQKNRDKLLSNATIYRNQHREELKIYFRENWEKKKNNPEVKRRKKEYANNHREQHRESDRKYTKSKKGKIINHKRRASRRKLGWYALFDNPFPEEIEVNYHHINDLVTIPIPKIIHMKAFHPDREEHRERGNFWLYYIYGMDFDKLINSD